jgi:hypothetical protein
MLLSGVLLGGLKGRARRTQDRGWWRLIPRCPSLHPKGTRSLRSQRASGAGGYRASFRFASLRRTVNPHKRRLKNGALKAQKRPELIYLINSGR